MQPGDEAWIVLDRDTWKEEDLDEAFRWSTTQDQFGTVVSNPNFEYWLLLHFEDGNNVRSTTECRRRLFRHLPNYSKSLENFPFSRPQLVHDAIERAQKRDSPPTQDWPRRFGSTTVYRLVRKLSPTDRT